MVLIFNRTEKKYRPHGKIILKLINKIRKLGLNALKILDVEDIYLLCEMKVNKPPYRLYVIVDQKSNRFYLVDWEHKSKQEKIIENLKKKLKNCN